MSSAFALHVDDGGLGTLVFDHPEKKVNVFTREALTELAGLVDRLSSRQDIRCLVLMSGKPRMFIAGADIEEIAHVTDPDEAAEGARLGQRLFNEWSELPFPTVAAVRGTCLGGGTELALASDHILISDRDDIRIGLPEIKLGIVPAWGGCTRLPRKIGLPAALDIILAGRAVHPKKAFKVGLADALLPDASFDREVARFANGLVAGEKPRGRRTGLKDALLEKNPIGRKIVFDQARKQVLKQTSGHYPAPLRALEVVKVGLDRGLDAGLEAEARAVGELAVSAICKNLVHLFHLMERSKSDVAAGGAEPKEIRSAAVLGAGVMGGGIAQLIAGRADVPVRMKDLAPEPLAGGMAHAWGLFKKQVKRRRLSRPEALEKMNLLLPTLGFEGFERADIVIEAIVENLGVKQKVFAELAAHVRDDTVLASNTSSLSIDLIGRETPHRERVVGMHFFNPVDKMPLVEVIAGSETSPATVSTIAAFSRRLGKTPVVVKDGPGFLVNRLLMFYMAEAMWLLDEGYSVEDLDRAMTDWGMPMGPMALTDEVGIDVAVKVAHILGDAFAERLPLPAWMDHLAGTDRLGTKSGAGIYRYDGRKRTGVDTEIYGLLGLAAPARKAEPARLVERMILPMVNEGARCLAEGVVADAGDLDLAMIMGTGFPPFRGGLCRWADREGLAAVVEAMERLSGSVDSRYRPASALLEAVEAGGLYARWPAG